MATKPDEDEDVLDLTADQQLEAAATGDDPDAESEADGDDIEGPGPDDEGEGDEETVVSLGDAPEDDQEGDSSTIRNLRKELREAKARLREGEKAPVKRELRPEPTSEDHAFDDDAFKADYKAWLEEKAEIEREESQASERQQVIQREWEADVQRFESEKAQLGFEDLPDAQDMIASTFNLAQQAVIVKAAEKPALLMYALAKAPAKAAELAKITDVIKLAAAIAKLEGTVKVTKRRKGPAIDAPQRGSGKTPEKGDLDKRLAALEQKVENGGDRSELIAFKKKHNLL